MSYSVTVASNGQDILTMTPTQEMFVVGDDAYERMLNKLQMGASVEYTYVNKCPHHNRNPRLCNCARFINVLKNGKIVRLIDGTEKPVYRLSEIANMWE